MQELRSKLRFSLKNTMDGAVNENQLTGLEAGDIGESVSALKPVGKALFDDREFEVTSLGGWIDEHQKIRIIKLENHKILVEKEA